MCKYIPACIFDIIILIIIKCVEREAQQLSSINSRSFLPFFKICYFDKVYQYIKTVI